MSTEQTELLDAEVTEESLELSVRSSFKELTDEIDAALAPEKTITVKDHTDVEGQQKAHKLRIRLVRGRNQLKAAHKKIKAPYWAACKTIDGINNEYKGKFEPVEARLQVLEDTGKREKERLAEEARKAHDAKMKERCEALQALGTMIPNAELELMDDARFAEVLAEKQNLHDAKVKQMADEAEARRVENERLEKDRKDQEKREAEIARKEKELADREAANKEAERQAKAELLANRQAAITEIGSSFRNDDMLSTIDSEQFTALLAELKARVAEADRVRKEAIEKEVERKRVDAEQEKARLAALAPDLEQIEVYALAVRSIEVPQLSPEAAESQATLQECVNVFLGNIASIAEEMRL